MQSTSISLLTRDGALSATFTPALDSPQYDRLLREVVAVGASGQESQTLLNRLAIDWNCNVFIDSP